MHGELILHCQMSKSTDTARILSILSGGRICSIRGDYLSAETSVDVFLAAPKLFPFLKKGPNQALKTIDQCP